MPKTITLKVHEYADGSHRVQLDSPELDAVPVFQIMAEMLPRLLRKMSPEENKNAREIFEEVIREL